MTRIITRFRAADIPTRVSVVVLLACLATYAAMDLSLLVR